MYLGSILTSLLFLVVNLTCAMLIHGEVPQEQLRWTVLARALVNDSLFILCAISLACCMCKLGKMSSANVYLESKVGKCLVNRAGAATVGWVPSWVCVEMQCLKRCRPGGSRATLKYSFKYSFPCEGGSSWTPLSRSACSCDGDDASCML